MKDNVVQVNLWDKNVGLLSWDDKRGCSVFQFDQDFMQYGWNIAPLVAPLDSVYVQRTFPMSGNREKLYAGLPEFIADSLPDHWGNVVFQKWMEANHLFLRKNKKEYEKIIRNRSIGSYLFRIFLQ